MGSETPTPPWEILRHAMDDAQWSQIDLAFVLGVTTATVNQLLNGKRGISHSMAKALGNALNIPPKELVRLQSEWDLSQTAEPDPIVAARARVLGQYPLREMIRRGWIDPEHRKGSLEEQVCSFFGVESLDDVPHLDHAGKKASYTDIPPEQLAWLFRVRQIAMEMHPVDYSPAKLRDAVTAFEGLRDDVDGIRHVPGILSDAGVRFVVVEGLPSSQIDGVCFWLNSKSPVIGMSLRFDRIDNFWFVLRHECAHVLHEHGKSEAIVDVDLERDASSLTSDEERIANSEAAEFCVPSEQLRSFYLRKKPFFSETDVLAFSKRMKVHPGLTVGQLQRMTTRYDLLRKYLVKVRQNLAGSMMMDGWGDVVPVDN